MLAKYDVAIDMHEGTRGAVMCYLTCAPIRIGNKPAKRSFLYNTKLDFSDLKPKFPIDYQVALIKTMVTHFDHVGLQFTSQNLRDIEQETCSPKTRYRMDINIA
jgi:ADP-heptose:LPS heptosyltransferase